MYFRYTYNYVLALFQQCNFYASANEVAGCIMFSGRMSVRPSVPFCVCRSLKNREVVLHQTWYEGISWEDNTLVRFWVHEVKGHRGHFVKFVNISSNLV